MIMYYLEAPVDANVKDILAFLARDNQVIPSKTYRSDKGDGEDITVNFHVEQQDSAISINTKIYTTPAGKLSPRNYLDEPSGQGNEVIRFEITRLTDARSLIKGLYQKDNMDIELMFYRRWTRLGVAFGAGFTTESYNRLEELEKMEEKWDFHESSITSFGSNLEYYGPPPKKVKGNKAPSYHDVFISYSHTDSEFAKHLHSDLQRSGVQCFFAQEDMKIGDQIRPTIDRQIRMRDKLLVILSENSLKSEWVGDEVESALEEESKSNRLVLFPIRLDDTVLNTRDDWAAKIKRRRHIGDFSNWKDEANYKKAFESLLRDLKAMGGQVNGE